MTAISFPKTPRPWRLLHHNKPFMWLRLCVCGVLFLAIGSDCSATAARNAFPGNARAYAEYAAGVYAELNADHKLALEHYRRAVGDLSGSADITASIGSLYLKLNEPQQARRYILRAADLAPDAVHLTIAAAQICLMSGALEEGARHIEAALEKQPLWPSGYQQLAEVYKQLRMWASAADTYARLSRLPRMRVPAYERLADLYLELGQELSASRRYYGGFVYFQRALQWYDEVDRMAPDLPSVLIGQAKCYRGTFQFKKAIRKCEKYIKLKPKDVAAQMFAARIHRQTGSLDDAVEAYRRLLSTGPLFFKAHAELVETLFDAGRLDEACEAASDLTARFPGNLIANSVAGRCFLMSGRMEDAKPLLLKAVQLQTQSGGKGLKGPQRAAFEEAVFLLGMVHLQENDIDRAMHYFGRALELDPENADANNNLGYLTLENGGDIASALRLIRRAVRIQPRSGEFLDSLGWAYLKLGRIEEATIHLEEASQTCRAPEVYDHLGVAYKAAGRLREARLAWEEMLAIDPEYTPAHDHLQQLLRETGASK